MWWSCEQKKVQDLIERATQIASRWAGKVLSFYNNPLLDSTYRVKVSFHYSSGLIQFDIFVSCLRYDGCVARKWHRFIVPAVRQSSLATLKGTTTAFQVTEKPVSITERDVKWHDCEMHLERIENWHIHLAHLLCLAALELSERRIDFRSGEEKDKKERNNEMSTCQLSRWEEPWKSKLSSSRFANSQVISWLLHIPFPVLNWSPLLPIPWDPAELTRSPQSQA